MPEKRVSALILRLLGFAFCVLPAAICTLSYFPLWIHSGTGSAVSGLALILLMISAVPLFRYFGKAVGSPSAPLIWFLIFLLFFFLSKIAEQITVIAFVGFIGNLIGSVLFNVAKRTGGEGNEA